MADNLTLPNAIDAYRKRAGDLYSQGAALYNAEPDLTEIQDFARKRGQEGSGAMLNALAAQFAGEQFQPVQAQFLKKAAAAQDPMKVGGGMLTGDGKFIKDPFATQDKRAEFLLRQAQAYEQLATTAQTAAERQAAQQQYQAIMAGIAGMNAQTNRMRAEQGAGGHFTQSGYTPEGKQLVTNNTGMNFVLEQGPQGQPVYTPYSGASIPKATFDKNVQEAQGLQATAARADALVKLVEQNAPAFGLRGAAVSALPGTMQGYAAKVAALSPQEMEARSTVLRQAAQEINDLYGAALSMGEQARAASFLPNPGDPPETTISKLKAARDWANTKLSTGFGSGVQNAASARSGGGQPAPAASGEGNLSLAERNELNRLRQKYGKGGQ